MSTKVYKRANRRLACQQKSREEVTIATGRKAARGFMNKTSTAIIYDFIIDLPSNIKEKKIVPFKTSLLRLITEAAKHLH